MRSGEAPSPLLDEWRQLEQSLSAAWRADDPQQMINRGHLLLETQLTNLVCEVVSIPSALRLDDLSFMGKLDLAIGLGLVAPEERGAFVALHRLRTTLLQNPGGGLTRDQAAAFVGSLGPAARFWLERLLGQDPTVAARTGEPASVLSNTIALLYGTLGARLRGLQSLAPDIQALRDRLRVALESTLS